MRNIFGKFQGTALALTLVIGSPAFADALKAGDRIYIQQPTDVLTRGFFVEQEIGSGTVKEVWSNGSVVFESDKFGNRLVPKVGNIEKPVSCGIKPNEYVYVTQAYESPGYVFRSANHRNDVGLALVKETFGDCKTGHAVISIDGATVSAPMASVLRNSTCDYTSGRAASSSQIDTTVGTTAMKFEAGEGSIAQMFGDCKTGVTLFRSDSKPFVDLIVDSASLHPISGLRMPASTAFSSPMQR